MADAVAMQADSKGDVDVDRKDEAKTADADADSSSLLFAVRHAVLPMVPPSLASQRHQLYRCLRVPAFVPCGDVNYHAMLVPNGHLPAVWRLSLVWYVTVDEIP